MRALSWLVGAELIFQSGTPLDAVYTFKHALNSECYAAPLRLLYGAQLRFMSDGFPHDVQQAIISSAVKTAQRGSDIVLVVMVGMVAVALFLAAFRRTKAGRF
jgi:hypothetical protein